MSVDVSEVNKKVDTNLAEARALYKKERETSQMRDPEIASLIISTSIYSCKKIKSNPEARIFLIMLKL